MVSKDSLRLPSTAFLKEDPSDDALFYRPARLVTHIDEAAIGALTARYAELIAPGSTVLDLMSSWVSHLPPDLALGEVIGHGMNASELAANPRLSRWFVQDLNRHAELPLERASVDTVLVCVGVQYLQRPMEVFAEVRRILRPRGLVIVSYSNRCFPTKAIAAWLGLDMRGRAELIRSYLEGAGFSDVSVRVLVDGRHGDPLVAVEGSA
ncbi:MAG TPA: methyltransferase domain-containing protein [Rubellimicrobium sp.]|jgi:SAM-dependent methyltransferase|nr:methyltransferase domain-containing protein [Rubellimicrobium sp.]